MDTAKDLCVAKLERVKSRFDPFTMEILSEVVKLRCSGGVLDYRSWLQEVIHDWKINGKISVQKKKDVQAVAKGLDWALGKVSSAPKIELKATIADAVAMKPPGGIDLSPTLPRFWGWFPSSLPGKRYRKLLTRAVVTDHEYPQLEERIKSVWRAG